MMAGTMFSVTAQYALRVLAYLSAQPTGSVVGGQELSRKTGIPRNYLSKLLLVLGNAGIIEATRGSGGGYRLSSEPEKTPLVRIVELFDRQIVKRGCLLGLRPVCFRRGPLHGSLCVEVRQNSPLRLFGIDHPA
jgi:Rrf2 family protein